MFKRKPIGRSKLTDKQDLERQKLEQEKKAGADPKKTYLTYAVIGLGVVCVIALGLLFKVSMDNKKLQFMQKSIEAKMKEMSVPKYDTANDFLLGQCKDKGVYCVSTQTSNPSLEIMKFLVNFRETPGFQYRLFFQVSVGGEKVTSEQLKCDGRYTDFYVCQEITAANPTDVIRAFEVSYRSLSSKATYNFDLMVKPVSELQYANPISMKPATTPAPTK